MTARPENSSDLLRRAAAKLPAEAAGGAVRRASRAELSALGAVLGRAFGDDPLMAWMFPEAAERAALLGELHERLLRVFFEDGPTFVPLGEPAGAAVWTPPGIPANGKLRRQIAAGIPLFALRRGGRGALRMMEAGRAVDAMTRRDLRGPHWVLSLLGVDPARQGRGIARDLVEAGLALADRDGAPAFLLTFKEANLGFYARWGFEVLGEGGPRGGPRGWSMRRKAR